MPAGARWVGLDVHAYETACATFDGTAGEVESSRLSGRPHELLAWSRRPTTTAARPGSPSASASASRANRPGWWSWPGTASAGSTGAGSDCESSAASVAGS